MRTRAAKDPGEVASTNRLFAVAPPPLGTASTATTQAAVLVKLQQQ